MIGACICNRLTVIQRRSVGEGEFGEKVKVNPTEIKAKVVIRDVFSLKDTIIDAEISMIAKITKNDNLSFRLTVSSL